MNKLAEVTGKKGSLYIFQIIRSLKIPLDGNTDTVISKAKEQRA